MGKTKSTTSRKPTKPAARPRLPADAAAPAVTGSQASYEQYLPAARALDAASVVPFRADASLAYHNVAVGLASLLARRAQAQALPGIDLPALSALPDKCLALAFAVDQALQASGGSNAALATLLPQASKLRRKLFAAADALVEAGLLPAAKVAALHAGKGKLDAANDLVGLAALFTANAAAIRGKTAITAADTTSAQQLGSQLLTLLKPGRARKTRPADAADAADVRDRMWTLVNLGWRDLWRACAYLYGPVEVDARVPPLQSRTATTSARKKANAAKKAAAPAPKAGAA